MAWRRSGGLLLLLSILLACRPARDRAEGVPASPEIWLWQGSHVNNPAAVDAFKKAVDSAAGYGYTGVALWDISAILVNSPLWPDPKSVYLREALDYAQSKGMKTAVMTAPFGYSNDVLVEHPNWAEAQRVQGTRFKVSADGRALDIVDSFLGLSDPGFEGGRGGWREKGDAAIDKTVAHGGTAAGVIRNASGDSRFWQAIQLTPWRQYHIQMFVRTQDYKGAAPTVSVLDANDAHKVRISTELDVKPAQDWTVFNAVFNSQDSSAANLYVGEWGGNSGAVWFDDVKIAETAMVHLIRREGAPFKIYDPSSGKAFEEGRDYDPVHVDKPLGDPYGSYQPPPEIRLPATTSLKPWQIVAVDSYAAQPIIPPTEFGMCLTDSGVQKWLETNASKIAAAIPSGAGIFLQYDEMRHLNSCLTCKAKNMTAGQLLAWHVGQTIRLYQSRRPDSQIYLWSDMFDPYHNAHDDYYLDEGDLAGSWKGLAPNVVIMNWNPERPKESLAWFAGRESRQPVRYRQIVAGTLKPDDVQARLEAASGVGGLIGAMYTTWDRDYSHMQEFAETVKRQWPKYRASLR